MVDTQEHSGGIRGRFRTHVRDEVKRVALRQLAESGAHGISVNAIAKELGVSGPALYRYFANRDALITALIIDAYQDFASALRQATLQEPPESRLRVLAHAYRAWAVAQPHRYRLLFAAPLPGYDAHSESIVAAAQQSMNVLLDALAAKGQMQVAVPNTVEPRLARWARQQNVDVPSEVALQAIAIWSRLHGWISLEIENNFTSMGLDPDVLFDINVAGILEPLLPRLLE